MAKAYDWGYSQNTWTETHTYMAREMSTNVHAGYIHGPPFVHVDFFPLNASNTKKFKH